MMLPGITYCSPVFFAPRRLPGGSREAAFAAPWEAWEACRRRERGRNGREDVAVVFGMESAEVVVRWRKDCGCDVEDRREGEKARSSTRKGARNLGCSISQKELNPSDLGKEGFRIPVLLKQKSFWMPKRNFSQMSEMQA